MKDLLTKEQKNYAEKVLVEIPVGYVRVEINASEHIEIRDRERAKENLATDVIVRKPFKEEKILVQYHFMYYSRTTNKIPITEAILFPKDKIFGWWGRDNAICKYYKYVKKEDIYSEKLVEWKTKLRNSNRKMIKVESILEFLDTLK